MWVPRTGQQVAKARVGSWTRAKEVHRERNHRADAKPPSAVSHHDSDECKRRQNIDDQHRPVEAVLAAAAQNVQGNQRVEVHRAGMVPSKSGIRANQQISVRGVNRVGLQKGLVTDRIGVRRRPEARRQEQEHDRQHQERADRPFRSPYQAGCEPGCTFQRPKNQTAAKLTEGRKVLPVRQPPKHRQEWNEQVQEACHTAGAQPGGPPYDPNGRRRAVEPDREQRKGVNGK